ncbi:unnamed protein product, partial [Symbiodinium sp. CCMP2592]
EKITQGVALTQEKVSKIALVLTDLLRFFEALKMQYALVWNSVPLAPQLYRRTLFKGEAGLLTKLEGFLLAVCLLFLGILECNVVVFLCFLEWMMTRDYEKTSTSPSPSPSSSSAMGYEFATLLGQLEKAKTAFFEAAERKAAEETERRNEEARKLKEEHARQEAAMQKEEEDRRLAEHAAQEKVDKSTSDLALTCKATAEEDTSTSPKPPASPEEEFTAKAHVIFDSAILPCAYDKALPAEMSSSASSASWRLWVVPSVGQRRGPHKFSKGMPALSFGGRFFWAADFTGRDLVLVLLGHDPSVEQDVKQKLKDLLGQELAFLAPLRPLVQKAPREEVYVEYALIAHGLDCPREVVQVINDNFMVVHGMEAYVALDLRKPVCTCANNDEIKACRHVQFLAQRASKTSTGTSSSSIDYTEDMEDSSTVENKKINPHAFGQSQEYFRQVLEKISPPSVVLPTMA